jgi:hypothetical protein
LEGFCAGCAVGEYRLLLTQKILHCLSTSGQPISLFPFCQLETRRPWVG